MAVEPGGSYIPQTGAGGVKAHKGSRGRKRIQRRTNSVTKSVEYSATINDTLMEFKREASASETGIPDPRRVQVSNIGKNAGIAIFQYNRWTDEDTTGSGDAGKAYLHFILAPGESITMPASRAVVVEDAALYDGELLTDATPDSNLYRDSGANMDNATATGTIGSNSSTTLYLEPWTDANNNSANLFRVGDLIRCTNEIMEVTAIGDKSNLANNYLTVRRGLFGSTAASDHADGDAILLPFFNCYHDFDDSSYNGGGNSSAVKVKTDVQGRFASYNFFGGYGRELTSLSGILPGSVAMQFYTNGYQGLGLSDIKPSTPTGLTASTTYYIKVSCDGSTAEEISITTDSSNGNFGGANGIVQKLQKALDNEFFDSTSNLFQRKVHVNISGGDLVLSSGSQLSTSAIALTAGASGAGASVRLLAQQNGRIPAVANIRDAIASRLESTKVYDPITYTSEYKDIFIIDDANGNLVYKNKICGSINYETGAIDFSTENKNAEFIVSAAYSGPLSGKQDATNTAKIKALVAVYGNTPQQRGVAKLKVDTF